MRHPTHRDQHGSGKDQLLDRLAAYSQDQMACGGTFCVFGRVDTERRQ
jgi:hypothetical protein